MICPFCGVEMKHGYLQTGLALWSMRKHKISLLTAQDEQYALKLKQPIASPNYIESDFCPECRRIIIDSTPYECSDNWGNSK